MIWLAFALWSAPDAGGATFARVADWPELAARSQAVVAGTVVDAETVPSPLGVATRYEIAVDDVLSGDPAADTVTLELPGGRVGDLVQRVGGVPLWAPGDEVVVFVPRAGPTMLAGVFGRDGDRLVDPLRRPDGPETVDALRAVLPRPVAAAPDRR